MNVRRGEIFYAHLSAGVGSEQNGYRTVLVVQNDVGNNYSPTIIVASISSKIGKSDFPFHVSVTEGEGGLHKDSIVLLEQLRTIDKRRLGAKVGRLPKQRMREVDKALKVSLHI